MAPALNTLTSAAPASAIHSDSNNATAQRRSNMATTPSADALARGRC
jgi:hypothetical protein